MAVGRHFEYGFIAITQQGIIRFQRNLVCSTSYASEDGHMTKCHNFANSTWQTSAIMKIVFRLYSRKTIFIIAAVCHGRWYYFRSTLTVFIMATFCLALVWLSVPLQVTDCKDSSPKWPIMIVYSPNDSNWI